MSNPLTLQIPEPRGTALIRTRIKINNPDAFLIGRMLAKGGLRNYEPEVLAMLCSLVEAAPGRVRFLDIGANVAIFSLVLKAAFGTRVEVDAFEPLPSLAKFVETTVRDNSLSVTTHRLALSNENGSASLYVSAKSDSSNSLNRRFRVHKDVIDVEVKRLDTFLEDKDLEATHVWKIDTESTEPDVLAGAGELIDELRPFIVCEILAGRTESAIADFCKANDYKPLQINGAPKWAGESITGDDTYEFRDWILLPSAASDELKERFAAWYSAVMAS